jgi:hypothetical protein
MMRAMPTASLRSLLLIYILSTALAWRASMQITGRLSRLSSVHSQVVVGPVSMPILTVPGTLDLTNEAIASGSESTTPSCTIDPVWFTTQIDVRLDVEQLIYEAESSSDFADSHSKPSILRSISSDRMANA